MADLFFQTYSFEREKEEKEEAFMNKAVEKTLADPRLTEEGRAR